MKTFNEVYRTWHDRKSINWTKESAVVSNSLMTNHVIPALGNKPVDKIDGDMIDKLLIAMDKKGFVASRKKAYPKIVSVFKLAKRKKYIKFNPSLDIDTSDYKTKTSTPRATSVKPKDISKILNIFMNNYHHLQTWQVTIASQLMPYMMSRPIEVCGLLWSEVNFEDKVIFISKDRMKSDRDHQIPMSKQVFDLLKQAETYRENSKYVFPSPRGGGHISTRSILQRIRRAGIKTDELTTHGFRSMASTLLNEGVHIKGFSKDVIEMQLAHKDTSQRGVYNHAVYYDSRVDMMQSLADYLDSISKKSQV